MQTDSSGFESSLETGNAYIGMITSLKPVFSQLPEASTVPWVRAMQLSLWDNICGPRIVHVWTGEAPLGPGEQAALAQQTLKDEICRPLEEHSLETKLHVLPEVDSVIASVVFAAQYEDCLQRFALSLLVVRSALKRFLSMHRIVTERMLVLAEALRTLLPVRAESVATELQGLLGDTVYCFHRVYTAGICVDDLALAESKHRGFSATLFGRTAPPPYDYSFLGQAVASHIQTHACTVVAGESADQVDEFLGTLALFCTDEQLQRSSLCTPANRYVPGLALQGLVGALPVDETVLWAPGPSTLIQLGSGDKPSAVLQCLSLAEYGHTHRLFLDAVMRSLLTGASPYGMHTSLFRAVREPPMVEQLVIDILRLPVPLRRARAFEGMRVLRQQTVLLMKHVAARRAGAPKLARDSALRIREDMGLCDGDFELVVCLAEAYAPGVGDELLGNPGHMEKQLQILLESFL